MASPNFDSLSVRLSRELRDPVASATTDGKRFSSAQRSSFLNAAIRAFKFKAIRNSNFSALSGYLTEDTQSLSNNVKALSSWSGGVAWILGAYNVTDSVPIKSLEDQSLRFYVESGGSTYLAASATNQYWVRDGSNFRLLDGTSTSNDSVRLRFIKQHADLSANGATDIAIGSEYWEEILNLAVAIGNRSTPTPANIARSVMLEQNVEQEVEQSAKAVGNN